MQKARSTPIPTSRDYKALELQVDRAWDGKWGFNASYTLAYGRGNAEGPVNSDTDFADAGRTENFDNPWVNYRAAIWPTTADTSSSSVVVMR